MATSRFTPPGATAPSQFNNAARRGAARGAARVLLGRTTSRSRHTRRKPVASWPDVVGRPTSFVQLCATSTVALSRPSVARDRLAPTPRETLHGSLSHSAIATSRCPALASANERARTSPRTKQTSDTRHPPRLSNARTERESNRPRDGRGRDGVRDRQRCAVARLLACW